MCSYIFFPAPHFPQPPSSQWIPIPHYRWRGRGEHTGGGKARSRLAGLLNTACFGPSSWGCCGRGESNPVGIRGIWGTSSPINRNWEGRILVFIQPAFSAHSGSRPPKVGYIGFAQFRGAGETVFSQKRF